MEILDLMQRALDKTNDPDAIFALDRGITEIERLREDLDLTQRVARAEIDAKIRYAWALSEITKLKPEEEFGDVPIETAQRIASEALKWKE